MCAGVPAPSNPVQHDPPPVATPPNGDPQETDGTGVIYSPPVARLQPYGPFWWAGGAGAPAAQIPGYFIGGGGTAGDPSTLVTCAVILPTTGRDLNSIPGLDGGQIDTTPPLTDPYIPPDYLANPDPAYLAGWMSPLLPFIEYTTATPPVAVPHGAMPSVDDPCGNKATTDADGNALPLQSHASIGEVGPRQTFNGPVIPPAATSHDINTSGYYGLYTTAIRAQTPGNDCFNHSDGVGPINDDVDCLVEPLAGVEWVIGVDATRPTASLTTPIPNQVFIVNSVPLDLARPIRWTCPASTTSSARSAATVACGAAATPATSSPSSPATGRTPSRSAATTRRATCRRRST